jgi:D-proline reductase (dithiol) PrdB
VGLVARVIEAAGVSTAVHSWMPEISTSVGSPRVVGIGYPGSLPFGLPGDAEGQRAVLRASLESAAALTDPGARVDLTFEWPQANRVPKPPKPPPIATAIMKRPWLFMNLVSGKIPGSSRDPG